MYCAVIALAGATLTLATAKPASAAGTPLQICNRTTLWLEDVAVGYHSSGVNDTDGSRILTGPFVSTGWSNIAPGVCRNFANPFGARYMFWWAAQSNMSTLNGINDQPGMSNTPWHVSGNDHFCIPDPFGHRVDRSDVAPTFTLEDDNVSEVVCVRGRANPGAGINMWVGVRSVDVSVNPIVTFVGE